MAYSEALADRIRVALAGTKKIVEKKMFGGIAFMINDKMCVGVHKDDLILRCEPDMTDELIVKKGARPFDLSGKPMKGWLLVESGGCKTDKQLIAWIKEGVEFASTLPPK